MVERLKQVLLAHWVLLLMLVLLGGLHMAILLTSQSHVDGDEGVVGVMALHILTRQERPLFFYGQVYGTGAALEAYLAAVVFILFGSSSISLKMVGLLLFWGAMVLMYLITRRVLRERAALWAVTLLGVATPLVEWRTKMRGGYAGIPFFTLLILFIYGYIIENEPKRWWHYLLLGLAMGGAWFNSTLALSLLVAVFVHSLFVTRRFYRWSALLVPVGGLLALSPLIVHDVRTDYVFLRYLLTLGSNTLTKKDVVKLFTEYLPRFFLSRNVDQYVSDVPWLALLEYGIYAVVVATAVILFFMMRQSAQKRLLGLALLALFSHLIFFTISKDKGSSARYLLPVIVPLILAAVIVWQYVWQAFPRILPSWLATAVLTLLVVIGLYQNLIYLRPPIVTDDISLTDRRVVNVQTDGELAVRLIDYLQEQGITRVRTGYFLQWRILFESQEAIIASSEGYDPTILRFAEYDMLVAEADRVALIQHRDSLHFQEIKQSEWAQNMQRAEFDDYVVFTP